MRPRALVLLALAVLALGAFIWLYERELPAPKEREALARRLLRTEAPAFDHVTIRWRDGEVALERVAAAADGADEPLYPWRLRKPVEEPAEGERVERLLRDLSELETQRRVEDADRVELGLDPPRVTVTLRAAAVEQRLEVGVDVPGREATVAALAGAGEMVVIPSWIVGELTREPGEWRLRSLVPGTRADLRRVALERPEERVELARIDGEVQLVEPLADRIDPDQGRELLNDLAALRVERFLDAAATSASDLGLDPPAGRILVEVDGRDGPVRLDLGRRLDDVDDAEPLVAARHAGRLVALPGAVRDHLERPADGWRSRAWTHFDDWDVERGELELAGRRLAFERRAGSWLDAEGRELPRERVQELLEAVTGARAAELVEPGEAAARGRDAADPELRLLLVARDGREESLELGAAGGGLAPARTAGRDTMLLLPAATAGEVHAAAEALLEAVEALTAASD